MRITAMIEGACARITPHGPIEYDTLPALHGAVVDLPPEVTEVIWDLSDTEFMDVAGLHLLFDQLSTKVCRRTAVTGLTGQPKRLLLLTAGMYPDLDVAAVLTDPLTTAVAGEGGHRDPAPLSSPAMDSGCAGESVVGARQPPEEAGWGCLASQR